MLFQCFQTLILFLFFKKMKITNRQYYFLKFEKKNIYFYFVCIRNQQTITNVDIFLIERKKKEKKENLDSSISNFTDFGGVENLPRLKMKGLVEPPCRLRGRYVHEPISHIALVAASSTKSMFGTTSPIQCLIINQISKFRD